ncbi:MAG: chemotaxis protein CheD [Lachnospirales bacterium]
MNNEENAIVNVSDMKIVKQPVNLTTMGLGSCLGVSMYDKKMKIGGLLHARMPYIMEYNNKENEYMFVDSGIRVMYRSMLLNGAKKENIEVKLVGGAGMFDLGDSYQKIGERNLAAALETLKELRLEVSSKDCGGKKSRTVILDTTTGFMIIKSSVGRHKRI